MSKRLFRVILIAITAALVVYIAVTAILGPSGPYAHNHEKPVTAYVQQNVAPWLSDPTVLMAVEAQNQKHQALTKADIDKLDGEWVGARKAKLPNVLMDALMTNELAAFLRKKKEASGGAIAELIVMDNKGLNVGQTDITLDYMQGDEPKWQKSFGVGPDAIFVDKVQNENGLKVSQTSLTISDPKTKKAIGAITVVVDVDKLPK